MAILKVGDKAPDFKLQADDGGEVSLAGLRGKRVVLYFFPKALTPG
jgi:peroxiredoxin Q/BCP